MVEGAAGIATNTSPVPAALKVSRQRRRQPASDR